MYFLPHEVLILLSVEERTWKNKEITQLIQIIADVWVRFALSKEHKMREYLSRFVHKDAFLFQGENRSRWKQRYSSKGLFTQKAVTEEHALGINSGTEDVRELLSGQYCRLRTCCNFKLDLHTGCAAVRHNFLTHLLCALAMTSAAHKHNSKIITRNKDSKYSESSAHVD